MSLVCVEARQKKIIQVADSKVLCGGIATRRSYGNVGTRERFMVRWARQPAKEGEGDGM